jgi:hypothetical protein
LLGGIGLRGHALSPAGRSSTSKGLNTGNEFYGCT